MIELDALSAAQAMSTEIRDDTSPFLRILIWFI